MYWILIVVQWAAADLCYDEVVLLDQIAFGLGRLVRVSVVALSLAQVGGLLHSGIIISILGRELLARVRFLFAILGQQAPPRFLFQFETSVVHVHNISNLNLNCIHI